MLDCELERQGYSRQVAMKTPSMLSAPFIIEQSDLLMALPRRAAETMARAARLTIFPLPFPVPPFDVQDLRPPTQRETRGYPLAYLPVADAGGGSPPLPDALSSRQGISVTPGQVLCRQPTATYPGPGHKTEN